MISRSRDAHILEYRNDELLHSRSLRQNEPPEKVQDLIERGARIHGASGDRWYQYFLQSGHQVDFSAPLSLCNLAGAGRECLEGDSEDGVEEGNGLALQYGFDVRSTVDSRR